MAETSANSTRLAGALLAAAVVCALPNGASAGGLLSIPFDATTFNGDPLVIDNPYWPLSPDGTPRTLVYEAETDEECVRSEITASGVTKTLMGDAPYHGFQALEVEDKELVQEDCEGPFVLTEWTFDWYRQDDYDNVWYLGELSRSYEDDCAGFSDPPSEADRAINPDCYEGSWEAGRLGPEGEVVGQSGIVVPSDEPRPGTPLTPGTYFQQEVAEGAEDMAKVLRQNARVAIEEGDFAGVYGNCRTMKEWTRLEPGAVEKKHYCPGSEGGLILIEELSGAKTVRVILVEIADGAPLAAAQQRTAPLTVAPLAVSTLEVTPLIVAPLARP